MNPKNKIRDLTTLDNDIPEELYNEEDFDFEEPRGPFEDYEDNLEQYNPTSVKDEDFGPEDELPFKGVE